MVALIFDKRREGCGGVGAKQRTSFGVHYCTVCFISDVLCFMPLA